MCLYMCVVQFFVRVGVFGRFVNMSRAVDVAMVRIGTLVLVLVLWKSRNWVEPRQDCKITLSCVLQNEWPWVNSLYSAISGPLFSGTNPNLPDKLESSIYTCIERPFINSLQLLCLEQKNFIPSANLLNRDLDSMMSRCGATDLELL